MMGVCLLVMIMMMMLYDNGYNYYDNREIVRQP